jgi:hypothetical protein
MQAEGWRCCGSLNRLHVRETADRLRGTMKTRTLFASALICFFVATGYAQSKYTAHVKLEISCKDQSVKDELSSFLSRELRSLRDVDLSDDGNQGVFRIVVVVVPTIIGEKTVGQAISMVVTQRAFCATDIPAAAPAPKGSVVAVTYNTNVFFVVFV